MEIEGIPLAMFWNRENYYDLIQKFEYAEKAGGQTNYVSERQAPRWVIETLSYKNGGEVNKDTLDNQRKEETSSLDMMQNSAIIYHPESINEM